MIINNKFKTLSKAYDNELEIIDENKEYKFPELKFLNTKKEVVLLFRYSKGAIIGALFVLFLMDEVIQKAFLLERFPRELNWF